MFSSARQLLISRRDSVAALGVRVPSVQLIGLILVLVLITGSGAG